MGNENQKQESEMTAGIPDKMAILAKLPVGRDEDLLPGTVGGFSRRWFKLIDALQVLIDAVKTVKGTEDEDWVPAWSAVAKRYENEAEALLKKRKRAAARNAFLQAKSFYSIARFPAPYHSGSAICPPDMSPIKAQAYQRYLECYRRATELALDALAKRPEIDGKRLGAFGVSRGGLWVMRLAAHDARVKALISCAPGGVGYWGTPEERAEWRKAVAERARTNWFGPRGTKPAAHAMTEEEQRKEFLRWSLKDNGLLPKLTMPMYLVNGKVDHLTPIGNLYLLLESGPPPGRVARVYADDGHIAARNEKEWAPAAWRWLREQLAR